MDVFSAQRMSIHREVQEMVQHVMTDAVLKQDKREAAKPMIQVRSELTAAHLGSRLDTLGVSLSSTAVPDLK